MYPPIALKLITWYINDINIVILQLHVNKITLRIHFNVREIILGGGFMQRLHPFFKAVFGMDGRGDVKLAQPSY